MPKAKGVVAEYSTGKRGIETDFIDNSSIMTVYRNAVKQSDNVQQANNVEAAVQQAKRDSSSSEECLDLSDESGKIMLPGEVQVGMQTNQDIDQFISDVRRMSTDQRVTYNDDIQPHCSGDELPQPPAVAQPQIPQLS